MKMTRQMMTCRPKLLRTYSYSDAFKPVVTDVTDNRQEGTKKPSERDIYSRLHLVKPRKCHFLPPDPSQATVNAEKSFALQYSSGLGI